MVPLCQRLPPRRTLRTTTRISLTHSGSLYRSHSSSTSMQQREWYCAHLALRRLPKRESVELAFLPLARHPLCTPALARPLCRLCFFYATSRVELCACVCARVRWHPAADDTGVRRRSSSHHTRRLLHEFTHLRLSRVCCSTLTRLSIRRLSRRDGHGSARRTAGSRQRRSAPDKPSRRPRACANAR